MAYTYYQYQEAQAYPQEHQYHRQPLHSSSRDHTHTMDTRPHAPRRVQHGYSHESGAYIYDVGAYSEVDPYRIPRSTQYHYSTDKGRRYEPSSRRDAEHRSQVSSSSRRSDKNDSSSTRLSTTSGSSKRSSRSSTSPSSTLLNPPRTPEIGRLSTPELAPLSAGLRFCSCGCSAGYLEEEERYVKGRAAMDSKLQNAVDYMASQAHDKSSERR